MKTIHGKTHDIKEDVTGWPVCSCGWMAYNSWHEDRLAMTQAHIDLEIAARR